MKCSTCKYWIATKGNEGFCGNSPVRVASIDIINIELTELGLSANDRENIKNLILGGLRTDDNFRCINYQERVQRLE